MLIRTFDIILSFLGILLLTPLLLVISILLLIFQKDRVFFVQERVGQHGRLFRLLKFRTMRKSKSIETQLTIGNDKRITRIGKILRKYKLDELPQLYNVLKGDMSIVGPRPEVQKYVCLYTAEQKEILSSRPGITDRASIKFSNESEILGRAENPDELYINYIIPEKIALSMSFVKSPSLREYFGIILMTIKKLLIKSDIKN